MYRNLKNKKIPPCEVKLSPIVTLLSPCQVDRGSGVVRGSEFSPCDIAGSLNPFTSRDFSISSLQSVGALNTLKSTYMSYMSNMNVADKFENFTLNVENQ